MKKATHGAAPNEVIAERIIALAKVSATRTNSATTLKTLGSKAGQALAKFRASRANVAVYFLALDSAFAFNCASSLLSFANADLSSAISARAAARSRPAALIFSCVSRPSLVSAC